MACRILVLIYHILYTIYSILDTIYYLLFMRSFGALPKSAGSPRGPGLNDGAPREDDPHSFESLAWTCLHICSYSPLIGPLSRVSWFMTGLSVENPVLSTVDLQVQAVSVMQNQQRVVLVVAFSVPKNGKASESVQGSCQVNHPYHGL